MDGRPIIVMGCWAIFTVTFAVLAALSFGGDAWIRALVQLLVAMLGAGALAATVVRSRR